ncbi:hypothetical protein POM88_017110 [Heracleum sosnowskyi]|uniref:Helitron helicase-like domain-containing protein n=1 Tax=Heracleum sosnowskyi TaxID=360622 RepID=A0AAD8IR52_9APIA|nr:hypothetical protein POM88_017110 [Heracleum sosnowskyi]
MYPTHSMHQMDESINNSLKSITQTGSKRPPTSNQSSPTSSKPVLKRRHGSPSQTNNALRSLDLNLESQQSNTTGSGNADVVTPTPNRHPLKFSSNVLHDSVLNRRLNPIQKFARSPSNIHYHDKNKENLPPNTGKQISKLNGETLFLDKSKFVLLGNFLLIYKTFVAPRTPLGISQSPSLTPQSEQPVSTSSIRSDRSSLAQRSNFDYLHKKINVISLISPSARRLAEVDLQSVNSHVSKPAQSNLKVQTSASHKNIFHLPASSVLTKVHPGSSKSSNILSVDCYERKNKDGVQEKSNATKSSETPHITQIPMNLKQLNAYSSLTNEDIEHSKMTIYPNHQSDKTENNYASTSGTKNLLDTFNAAAEDDDGQSTDFATQDDEDFQLDLQSEYLSDDSSDEMDILPEEIPLRMKQSNVRAKVAKDQENEEESKHRAFVSLREYYAYKLMIRPNEGMTPHLRDVVTRVFKMKLDQLVDLIKNKNYFGRCIGLMYVIEFQKREIPDKDSDPIAYNAVKNFMIHGPCGHDFSYSPCMANGKCIRHFPKRYNGHTFFDDCGFPVYRRRRMNRVVEKNEISLDNQFVVPYNRDLLIRFQCHMNLEVCNNSRSLKYLFKYCLKGHDNATMLIQRKKDNLVSQKSKGKEQCLDEVKHYLDGRYVCASEAAWRILGFDIHYRFPSVERLPVHVPGGKTVSFKVNDNLEEVAEKANSRKSKLEAWFIANKTIPSARDYTYQDFPRGFTWLPGSCKWKIRERGIVVGRLTEVHASSGDAFFLRMLLLRIKGATSFKELRTVNGQVYSSFKEACDALGLLKDDNQWHAALKENSHSAFPQQIRSMFVHILTNCPVADPLRLWEEHWTTMSDDILYSKRKASGNQNLTLGDEDLMNYTLAEIEKLLNEVGKSLKDFPDIAGSVENLDPVRIIQTHFGEKFIVRFRIHDGRLSEEDHGSSADEM